MMEREGSRRAKGRKRGGGENGEKMERGRGKERRRGEVLLSLVVAVGGAGGSRE